MDWKEYSLGELLDYEQPAKYIVNSTEYNNAYKTPVLTAGKSFIIGYTNEKDGVFEELPVIIFDDFTTATQYVNFRFKVKSSAMKILKPKKELVNPKFIYYRMQNIQFDHSTHKRYWLQHYSKLRVAIPDLIEQQRIVSRIEELFSELDAGIEDLKKIKDKLTIYRQAVLKEAFQGGITSQKHLELDIKLEWEKDIENLPSIPKEWRYIKLEHLGELARGKSKHRPRNDKILFQDGKYPFIQTGEVKAARDYITESHKFYNDNGLAQSKLWEVGTLCITIAANIAETAFLGIDACFPDSVVGFKGADLVNDWYIKYFISSQKERLWHYAPATAQKNINLKTLENLVIPYCSLKEQQIIVDEINQRCSIFDSVEEVVNIALKKTDILKLSILKQAFEGRM